ncbi:MAG: hypothetical protein RJQ09_14810 [Cyclobacteriaceae bacterium]
MRLQIQNFGYFYKTPLQMRGRFVALILCITLFSSSIPSYSQSETDNLEARFDEVAGKWHNVAKELDNYRGLTTYCTTPEYKEEVLNLLAEIHHFDSLIMDKFQEPSYVHKNRKEERKTLQSIEEFEGEYSLPNFVNRLDYECKERHEVEKDRKKTANEIGSESYSGQKLLVELELYKYIHHVDNRLDHIEKHLHNLHIDEVY